MSEISALLSKLEDPFQMFPLQEVARILSQSVENAENCLAQRAGWLGVSKKYRSVDEEHQEEVIFCLIGSAFVLGQSAITQSVAITKKIHDTAGKPLWLPNAKPDILNTEATIHQKTGLSETILFDAVANYFKHHREWSADWNSIEGRGQPFQTIKIVRQLGLSPDSDANLQIAMHNLGFGETGIGSLGESIQNWRERLTENLRKRLYEHNKV